ncbi:MAG: dTDP-4-dehydrorhamnose 3,5-epimerase family protein [Euryarchaeota archaeon]|nr:dTDP-4-dehydrorhamnose 3,5-epimerase family protein [Euryarchaeota archaeon]
MLDGIKKKQLTTHVDERGFFTELVRQDWLGDDLVQQSNFSVSYPGTVRAWHRHTRGQVDNFVVLRGAIKLCAYDDTIQELDEIILTGGVLQSARIPGHYWHGFRVLGEERAYLVYFVNKLYEYADPDEERRPWNDSQVVPRVINGMRDDPRCGKSWDWDYLSFK